MFCAYTSVLGASTMVGFDVIFDVENKRVGFAESNCGTFFLLEGFYTTLPDIVLCLGAS